MDKKLKFLGIYPLISTFIFVAFLCLLLCLLFPLENIAPGFSIGFSIFVFLIAYPFHLFCWIVIYRNPRKKRYSPSDFSVSIAFYFIIFLATYFLYEFGDYPIEFVIVLSIVFSIIYTIVIYEYVWKDLKKNKIIDSSQGSEYDSVAKKKVKTFAIFCIALTMLFVLFLEIELFLGLNHALHYIIPYTLILGIVIPLLLWVLIPWFYRCYKIWRK